MGTRTHHLDKLIGARLRAFRWQRRYTQTDLAKAVGVTFQQIQKYENGRNRVSGSAMVKLCELLDVKLEQLLGNGHGVFHSEPDLLEPLMTDKNMVKMLLEISNLPVSQRQAVVIAMVLMIRAFQMPRGKREAE